MFSNPKALLGISPSLTQLSIFRQLAEQAGLDFVACSDEREALRHLENGHRFSAMAIAHQLNAGGDSFQVIESARLSLLHATLPIAFVMSDHEPRFALNALSAGATEVFLTTEYESLAGFVADCAQDPREEAWSGKVLLVEDSEAHASYVRHLLQILGLTVDCAESVASANALYRRKKYLIIIIDIILNDTRSGISFVREIRQDHTHRQPILVMSGFDDLPRRLLALKSGADDFISKPFSPEELIWRIRKILHGHALLDHDDKYAFNKKDRKTPQQFVQNLSPRETEIFERILNGVADREIAQQLGISFWTVRSHIQQIFGKTGVLNRRELMARFIRPNEGKR